MDMSYQIRPHYLLESQVWYLLDIILDMVMSKRMSQPLAETLP